MQLLNQRRRHIRAKGRTVTLQRIPALNADPVAVSLLAVVNVVQSRSTGGGSTGGLQQGDAYVETLNDEIAAAGWPGPPVIRDQMIIDGRTWAVQGSNPLYDGETLIGHRIWIRGKGT